MVRKVRKVISKGLADFRMRLRSHESHFTKVFQKNRWGSEESVSGPGSTVEITKRVRELLPAILKKYKVEILLDAPCGDFNWLRLVDLPVRKYIGVDVVKELIERNRQLYGGMERVFHALNFVDSVPPKSDMILCRDCFIHFSFRDIKDSIDKFNQSGAEFLPLPFPMYQRLETLLPGIAKLSIWNCLLYLFQNPWNYSMMIPRILGGRSALGFGGSVI